MMSEQKYNEINQKIISLQAECQQLCRQKEYLEREYASGMDRYMEVMPMNIKQFQSKMKREIENCKRQYEKKYNKMVILDMKLRMDRGI